MEYEKNLLIKKINDITDDDVITIILKIFDDCHYNVKGNKKTNIISTIKKMDWDEIGDISFELEKAGIISYSQVEIDTAWGF